jgi:predicted transcriptional regulator
VAVRGFGELEAVVMARLWAGGGTATVREVFEQLRVEREIAYTTVQSTMDNLFRKGWVVRERAGRAYRYQTTASRAEYHAGLMRDALGGGDDSAAVLTHFVGQMSEEESVRLQELLDGRTDRGPR